MKITFTRPWFYAKQKAAIYDPRRYSWIEASTKAGKAQPLDALISTPSGWRKMGDIAVGDIIHGRADNTVVEGVFPQGERKIYRITFADGSTTTASDDHLWAVENSRGKTRVLSTEELLARPSWDFRRSYIPQHEAVEYDPLHAVELDPWLLGFLTGDGCFRGESLSVAIDINETETVDRVRAAITLYGCELVHRSGCDWVIRKPAERWLHPIIQILKTMGMWGLYSDQKFAPDFIKFGSIDVRKAYIQGLLDADGSVNKHGQPMLEQTGKQIAADFTHIINSLGGVVRSREKDGSYRNAGGMVACKRVYRQCVAIDNPCDLFSLSRKKNKCTVNAKPVKRTFRSIEYIGMQPCQCIKVSATDSLYLTDDFIVTHNTFGCIVWLVEEAFRMPGGFTEYWWVAPVSDQADIAFLRTCKYLQGIATKNNVTKKIIYLPTGSRIVFKSADNPDSLYGEDVGAAVADEASRMKESAFFALRSTLTATKGRIRIIGNVKGRGNWFFKGCRAAEHGKANHGYHKITAGDAAASGVTFDQEEIEDARATLPLEIFNELYYCIPANDGGNPFGITAIEKCWRPRLSSLPVFVWGWDVAKSRDWTCGIGLDVNGDMCRLEHFQKPWGETMIRMAALIGNSAALIDSTGVGDPIVELLQKKCKNVEGFKFTQPSKQMIMEGLAVGIQQQKLGLTGDKVRLELEQFEYEYTRTGVRYAAPEGYGMHDDTVCALALANHKRGTFRYDELLF